MPDQLCRIFGVKVPPFELCQVSQANGKMTVEQDDEWYQMSWNILREHALAWNLNGRMISAPTVTTWWIPYDLEAIMRYGHAVNSDIPEDPNEAEFPPARWPERVVIRVNIRASPKALMAPLPDGGDPRGSPSAPGLPSTCMGPALGQAAPISADAAALTDYKSANESMQVDGQEEEPQDEGLARLRGQASPDEEVHELLSWTCLEDYPMIIGISLPIKDWVGEEYHEIQFWEEATDLPSMEHPAGETYTWLLERFRSRSVMGGGGIPRGMPETFEGLTVRTHRMGKAGYIIYELENSFARRLEDQPIQAQITYEDGHARLGMGGMYSMIMLATEFWALTQNDWYLSPQASFERLVDGKIEHETL
jgi:hypothetical protein